MGTWGYGVLDDDFVRDVVDDFTQCLKRGESVEAASAMVLAKYGESTGDPDEDSLFWLALAHCQWTYDRIAPEVLTRISADLESGAGLERWADSTKDLEKRRSRVVAFVEKVSQQNPKPRKRPKLVVRKPVFEPGDCLSVERDDGKFLAALVLVADHSNPEYGQNLIGVLDFLGDAPPEANVFRQRLLGGRRWRMAKLSSCKPEIDVCWFGAYGFRTYRKYFTVVGTTALAKGDPRSSYVYSHWKLLRERE